ncbi:MULTISPECIES: SDR family oxidoreductase [unclassified Planococcus (in: firmicutes)]|uniref:SDR family oxidoreductase n=1 Tax=Planococcus TaxID=1372 RepID=UPI000C34D09E|nr:MULTISPECIES: SDR family oxidoreductase [unclassified Planococcus (in: firmicutes)]AUD12963.1 NAD(P)-dependent oxidoreductase [Planococcus sp. MB-3u-03]PKG47588.1 NAD(P)-dependent oxidoreductase [Planococcus sp. Urea-trap-24]PKG88089.1 NAD(P)-dependent oxidoreductase [Planococcus sp. Urea-3u-39]PKH36988.1 NAD(P)-dependent oxidoreductase [Planococcus sp. MB-3u-09]
MKDKVEKVPAQHQERQPGFENEMKPHPDFQGNLAGASQRLPGKVALITGGDSGIGRAIAVAFAKEGADVAISYLDEHEDAKETKQLVEKEGRKCLLIDGDIGNEAFCKEVISQVIEEFGKLDVLVNNAAEQHVQESLKDITAEQLEKTFRTNVFSMFHLTKAALDHLKPGASIINTTSITAFRGEPSLIDYSSTKGAILAFTRALSGSLAKEGIRVNGVAPGPIWTPLIPASFPAEEVEGFGSGTPLGRPGQPDELAPGYVYLASDDSSYVTGQVLHINGGTPY